jgi:recombination protein RecA
MSKKDKEVPTDRKELKKYIESKYNKGSLRDLSEEKAKGFYSTGIITVDAASGIGGFPQGNMIEIFGPESSGKSLLVLQAMGHAQKKYNKPSVYFDLEFGTPKEWMITYGIDPDMIEAPGAGLSAETAFDMVLDFVSSGLYAYVVIDSVVGLVPRAEIEGSMEDQQMAALARIMGKGLRKIAPELSRTETCLIFINQVRDAVGVMYGDPEKTPGGRVLKFYAVQRYKVKKVSGSDVKRGETLLGHSIDVCVIKNKLASPRRSGKFPVFYEKGVDFEQLLFDEGLGKGVIKRAGNKYSLASDEKVSVNGKEAFVKLLRDSVIYDLVYGQVWEKRDVLLKKEDDDF